LNFSKEIKTALLILSGIVIFIFGFNYLKGSSLLDNEINVHTLYADVEGLVVGANVTINGLNVGKVKKIDFDENFEKIKVSFSLRNDLTFSNQSIAQLYEAGLIGGKAIAILPDYSAARPVQDDDVLPSTIKPGLTELVNQQIAPLQNKLEGLLTSADSLFAGVSNVLNYNTQNNLKLALEGVTQSIDNVNKLSNSLSRVVNSNEKVFNSTLSHLEHTTNNLALLSDSLKQMPLASTVQHLEKTTAQIQQLVEKMEKGEGSLGKLLNEETLYNKLLYSAEALEALLVDLKSHPKRYVHFSIFGKKETTPTKD
jgi:phospholipid/cholesterol/gamma-HCH transport system substrate-binding protein